MSVCLCAKHGRWKQVEPGYPRCPDCDEEGKPEPPPAPEWVELLIPASAFVGCDTAWVRVDTVTQIEKIGLGESHAMLGHIWRIHASNGTRYTYEGKNLPPALARLIGAQE